MPGVGGGVDLARAKAISGRQAIVCAADLLEEAAVGGG